MQPHFTLDPPSFDAYNRLRSLVGWVRIPDHACREAFGRTLLFCCCFAHEELIGFGRVVGDGTIYFYLQDIMVAPNCQGSGIGSTIVQTLTTNLRPVLGPHTFLGLLAIPGTEEFYSHLNFEPVDPRRNTAMQWSESTMNKTGP